MNALVIARRELAEKRFVFITAAVLVALPFLVSLLPFAAPFGRPNFVSIVGTVLAVGFTLGLAIVLGNSTVAREVGERRFSFYFSKPVAASAIWFGKVLAAAVLLTGCYLILILPVLAYSGFSPAVRWGGRFAPMSLTTGFLALALFLLAHAVSTAARSRSPLILADLALAMTAMGIASSLIRRLYVIGAIETAGWLGAAIAGGAALVVLLGGAWQLERGRIDLRRNHVALSQFVWSGMAIVLALAGAFILWAFSATPGDLTGEYMLRQAKTGPWLFVSGTTRGHGGLRGKFLVNAEDGRFYRYRPSGLYDAAAAFTADGRRAAFLTDTMSADVRELRTLELDGKSEPVATGITTGGRAGSLVLSDDGSRLALLDDGSLRVIDLPSRREVAVVRLDSSFSPARLYFASNDVVRLFAMPATRGMKQTQTLRIFEFDTTKRALTETGQQAFTGQSIYPAVSADGATLLVRTHDGTPDGGHVVVADAHSGATMATLPVTRRTDVFATAILGGGRVAYVTREANGHVLLRVTGRDGGVDLGEQQTVRIAGTAAPGMLVVGATPDPADAGGYASPRRWTGFVVDLDRGAIVRRESISPGMENLFAADPRVWPESAHHLFILNTVRPVFSTWNPLTGEKKPLL